MLRHDLQGILGCNITLNMLTDSENLFGVSVKSSVTTEKGLMIYIRASREAYETGEFSYIGWIRSRHNLSDGLKTIANSKAVAYNLLIGILDPTVEQWVLRDGFQV